LQTTQLKGENGIGQTNKCILSSCLNVSKDGDEVMSEGILFHIHAVATGTSTSNSRKSKGRSKQTIAGRGPARNTLVQLLALYTNPERHNVQYHRQTDGWTDDRILLIADHTVYDQLKMIH